MKKSSSQKNSQFCCGILAALLALITLPCFAWGSLGHRLIGEIAFERLHPAVKHQVLQTLKPLEYYSGHSSFSFATTWADRLKGQDVAAFNQWHYINLGFSQDGTILPVFEKQNVVWAITESINTLKSTHADPLQKALFLHFLIHLVGDIHQPLHCANWVSKAHPNGDAGGNQFPIQYENMTNLHQLWDSGVGLRAKNLRHTAQLWQERYPPSLFATQLQTNSIQIYAQESFNIAKKQVYQITENSTPDAEYIEAGQETSRRQIVLAGYRLACILNQIYERDTPCLKS